MRSLRVLGHVIFELGPVDTNRCGVQNGTSMPTSSAESKPVSPVPFTLFQTTFVFFQIDDISNGVIERLSDVESIEPAIARSSLNVVLFG